MKIKSKEDVQRYWGHFASPEARRERFSMLYSMYVNDGLSLQQIAIKMNISRQRVHQILIREAREPELQVIKKRADLIAQNSWRDKEIEQQLDNGLSCSQIAKLLEVSVHVVKRVSARRNKAKKKQNAIE
jgi:predicted DNA-binding protein YlxM (UPF0122 family)